MLKIFLSTSALLVFSLAASADNCLTRIQQRYSHIPTVNAPATAVTAELESNIWGIFGVAIKVNGHTYLSFQAANWSNGEFDIEFDGEEGSPRGFANGLTWLVRHWNEVLATASIQNTPVKIDPRAIGAKTGFFNSCGIKGYSLKNVIAAGNDITLPPGESATGDRSEALPPGDQAPGKVLPDDGDRT